MNIISIFLGGGMGEGVEGGGVGSYSMVSKRRNIIVKNGLQPGNFLCIN